MTVTIITACFNSASVIRTAMDSVLAQSWPKIEYLVVDGGSSDGTLAIIREYEPKFSGRMRWISEPDCGMYDAINKGIRLANGELVGILNADDVLAADDVVAKVAEAFEKKEVSRRDAEDAVEKDRLEVVYGDIRFVANRQNAVLEEVRGEHTLRYYSARHWRPWMLRWGFMPPHPSVYIRRDCFERLGNYALDYAIAADYALLIRFLRKAQLNARYLPLCVVDMRVGGRSTRNWRSNLTLNREIVRGNREAGYVCCLPMLLPKYTFKVWEFLHPKIVRMMRRRT
jgi:glycosyltransferase involved in cell wall biosynthesis